MELKDLRPHHPLDDDEIIWVELLKEKFELPFDLEISARGTFQRLMVSSNDGIDHLCLWTRAFGAPRA